MLKKHTIMHILDACDRLLFDREDAEDIRMMLAGASELQLNRCYQAYIEEIKRQCRIHS